MSKEKRFDQLLMNDVKYWKVDIYSIDSYNNDNRLSSFLNLDYDHDDKKQLFAIDYIGIWSFLETEYSLGYQQIEDFTSTRLEQAYNFMDITTQ